MKAILLTTILLLFFSNKLSSQTVIGNIVDEDNFGLVGVTLNLYIYPDVYTTTTSTDGNFSFTLTEVKAEQLPVGYAVSNNFPNPFNPKTRIGITLPASGELTIEVFNLLGESVTEAIEKILDAGTNFVDIELNGLPNGVYLLRIKIDNAYTVIKKVMLVYGSQHLAVADGVSSKQLNKSGNSNFSVLNTIIDSLVATSSIIGRKTFTGLQQITGNILDLGNIVIIRYCPGTPTVSYLGEVYSTVLIGNQCWLKKNLNSGIRIDGSQKQTNNSPTNFIEKYCYNNDPVNCDTYGGLYQWDEAMLYSSAPTAQGICPSGWHIPTLDEFQTLTVTVGNSGNKLKNTDQGSGVNVGTNESGFSALLKGFRSMSGTFNNLDSNTYFWSSTEASIPNARFLGLTYITSNIVFASIDKEYGYSVRCIKGEPTGTKPQPPTLISPMNGATAISVQPTLTWNASDGADSYMLQVAIDTLFTISSLIYTQEGLTGTSQMLSGLNNLTSYYWRVNAKNSYGTSVQWSSIWSFTTNGPLPLPPMLLLPANGATNVVLSPILSWNTSSGATSYRLQVSTVNQFTSIVYDDSNITTTSQQVNGLIDSSQYYWRVNAKNSYGTSLQWSNPNFFTTLSFSYLEGYTYYSGTTIPVSGALIEIDTLSSISDSNGTYRLNKLTPGKKTLTAMALGFQSFSDTINVFSGSNRRNIEMTTMEALQLYGTIKDSSSLQPLENVLVVVLNNDSTHSKLQTYTDVTGYYQIPSVPQGLRIIKFIKQDYHTHIAEIFISNIYNQYDYSLKKYKPGMPSNPFPSDSAISQPLTITLNWTCTDPNGDLLTYDVYFDSTNPPTLLSSNLISPSIQKSGLSYNVTYYWKVKAKDNYNNSTEGPVWKFKTKVGPCDGITQVDYSEVLYNTKEIGNQCWLKENLNVGTRINGNQNATNNGIIEKYCINNDPNYCNSYGGLYQWNEAMQYATTQGARGICPPEWHIPTQAEFEILMTTVNNSGNALKEIGQGRGDGAGTNTSGFSALIAGFRASNGNYIAFGLEGYFLSSTPYSENFYTLYLNNYSDYVGGGNGQKN